MNMTEELKKEIYLYDENGLLIGKGKPFINPRNPNNYFLPSNSTLAEPPEYKEEDEYISFNKDLNQWNIKPLKKVYRYKFDTKEYLEAIKVTDIYIKGVCETEVDPSIDIDKLKSNEKLIFNNTQNVWKVITKKTYYIYNPNNLIYKEEETSFYPIPNSTDKKPPFKVKHKAKWIMDKKIWILVPDINYKEFVNKTKTFFKDLIDKSVEIKHHLSSHLVNNLDSINEDNFEESLCSLKDTLTNISLSNIDLEDIINNTLPEFNKFLKSLNIDPIYLDTNKS